MYAMSMRNILSKVRIIKYIYLSLKGYRLKYFNFKTKASEQRSKEKDWTLMRKEGRYALSDIKQAGFRCYSQYEEDGILLYLLSVVGKKTHKVVEICCGNAMESMSANLIINHGFKGFLFDGDRQNVHFAKWFFHMYSDDISDQPVIQQQWITISNINELLEQAGVSGEVDVLSIDMDGNDYYVWKAIEVISPRVCVFETHDIIPTELSLTVPYHDDFVSSELSEPDFRSVSLAAMVKVSKEKGYTLVGAHEHGFNVFFVRDDLYSDLLPKPDLHDIHDNPWSQKGQLKRWPRVKNHHWVKV